jgi:Galactose oxidase, central domain
MRALRAALVAVAMVSGCGHPLAVPRAYHTATPLPDGGVLVVGGDDSYPPHDRVGRYDLARHRWRAAASLPVGLTWHTATPLLDGRVLVVGGHGSDVEDRTDALVYEPEHDRWRAVAPMAHPRSSHIAVRLADGRVLVVGGSDVAVPAEIYDPRRNAWAPIAQPADGPLHATMTLLHNGNVLLVGSGLAVVYDPREDHWRATGAVLQPRRDHTATLLPDGRVFVVGGRAFDDMASSESLDSTELYEPRGNRWVPGPRLAEARHYHTTTLMGRVLVIVGGMPSGWGGERPRRSAELLELSHGRWSTRTIGRSRTDHTASALPDGRILLVGGRTELIVSKWNLRWSRILRLRGDLRRAARREATGPLDLGRGAHGSHAP